MKELTCTLCKKSFNVYPSRIGVRKYCSNKCRLTENVGGFKKGHKTLTPTLSEAHRKAIRLAGMGRKCPKTKAWREKISKALTGVKRPERSGANCHLWRGGITAKNTAIRMSSNYREWRRKVFVKDNFSCTDCGTRGDLHAHHIKEFAKFPELRFVVENGKTVCAECHSKIHGRRILVPRRGIATFV